MMQFDPSYFIVGGAGFIGSHFTDVLLRDARTRAVTVYDNLSSGRKWHVAHHSADPRFRLICGDAANLPLLTETMEGHDVVIHLASNPDIAKAATDPSIDFRLGTALTQNVLEAMRVSGAKRILYASGSGVYGDLQDIEVDESYTPLHPVSTYGASKLAGEGLISAYVSMFGITGCSFRFANVVGPRQTHGVGFDFLRKLRSDPHRLVILGDGTQRKSYIFVTDVVAAVLLALKATAEPYEVYNVATQDSVTVSEIAGIVTNSMGLHCVSLKYTGGNRGWKGDVPIVRLRSDRIRSLGWTNSLDSRESIRQSILSMLNEPVAEEIAAAVS